MVAVVLVLKLAINTFTRLMSIQIDEDSGMTQSRISSTVATNNSSLRFDDRFFCNQINGPTWISLLFFDHESSRPRIIFIPLLSCMSYLVGHCQSLQIQLKNKQIVFGWKPKLQFYCRKNFSLFEFIFKLSYLKYSLKILTEFLKFLFGDRGT